MTTNRKHTTRVTHIVRNRNGKTTRKTFVPADPYNLLRSVKPRKESGQ